MIDLSARVVSKSKTLRGDTTDKRVLVFVLCHALTRHLVANVEAELFLHHFDQLVGIDIATVVMLVDLIRLGRAKKGQGRRILRPSSSFSFDLHHTRKRR